MNKVIEMSTFTLVMLLTSVTYASDRVIQLASTDWAPYTGQSLTNDGFLSEVVSAAFLQMGYQVEFIYRPWVRALEETKTGKWHGVMDTYYTPDHLETMVYSDPIWTVQLSFFTLEDNTIVYKKIADLRPYKVGVVRGVEFEHELIAEGLKIEQVTNVTQNIKKILSKRIDVGISAKSNVLYKLKKMYSQEEQMRIRFLTPALKKEKVYVNFSVLKENYQQLTNDFNTGLRIIKEKGIYYDIIKRHGLLDH